MITEQNCTMLCDFYQLTMGNGYFRTKHADRIAYFDVFFRRVPDGGGYAICAGLEQVINYIQGLRFSEEDIQYLRGKGIFDEGFLKYLRDFKFTGDIWAVPEGTPVFPGGAAYNSPCSGNTGTACRNHAASSGESPVAYCNEGKPYCPGGAGARDI